jgi:hypothetical protein
MPDFPPFIAYDEPISPNCVECVLGEGTDTEVFYIDMTPLYQWQATVGEGGTDATQKDQKRTRCCKPISRVRR